MPLVLHPSIVLVTSDTAAAVLGAIPETVRALVDSGELVSFDFANSGARRELRIWTESITGLSGGMADPRQLIDHCLATLYRDRTQVPVAELGRRCSIDRSIIHRMIVRRELDLGQHGVTRASWLRLMVQRIQGCSVTPHDSVATTHAHCPTV